MDSINLINSLSDDVFLSTFANIIEHTDEAPEFLRKMRPFSNISHFLKCTDTFLDHLQKIDKENILKKHPDLAGRLAELNQLTEESKQEQTFAGLNLINENDRKKLCNFNEEYKCKFGFPFVICAKLNNIQTILKSIEERIRNSAEEELETGIEEVRKIAKLRLQQIIKNLCNEEITIK